MRMKGTGRNCVGGCVGSSPWTVDEVTRRWWCSLERATKRRKQSFLFGIDLKGLGA